MHGSMSWQSLKAFGHGNNPVRILVIVIHLFKLRARLQRPVQRHVQFIRHKLCERIAFGIRYVQYTPDIPDDTLCRKSSKGHDLRDTVLAVFPGHIIDDLLSPLILKVHVNIRHGNTLRIKETFKDQLIPHRVDIRDTDAVGYNGACRRASAWTDRNIMGFGIMDVVPDNQEIIDKAHGTDRVDFVLQSLSILLSLASIALLQSLVTKLLKV